MPPRASGEDGKMFYYSEMAGREEYIAKLPNDDACLIAALPTRVLFHALQFFIQPPLHSPLS